jgi:glycosyltransferase involved in cell wall biosynthesis
MMGDPLICVAIPTRNRAPLVRGALESVVGQLAPGDELMVVDNGSSDDTTSVATAVIRRCWPRGRVILESHRGVSHARNRALRESAATVVAFLDDDVRADPNWLAELRRAWGESGPRVAAIGGPMRPEWRAERPAWLEDCLLYVVSVLDLGARRKQLDQQPRTGYLWGGNMSYLRAAALEVGGFEPDVVYLANDGRARSRRFLPLTTARSGEEQGIQDRLTVGGWEVWYEPGAAVDHIIPPERVAERFFYDFFRQQAMLTLRRGRSRRPAAAVLAREAARFVLLTIRRDPRAMSARFRLAGAWLLATGPRRP